jgi:hypothetical protein
MPIGDFSVSPCRAVVNYRVGSEDWGEAMQCAQAAEHAAAYPDGLPDTGNHHQLHHHLELCANQEDRPF